MSRRLSAASRRCPTLPLPTHRGRRVHARTPRPAAGPACVGDFSRIPPFWCLFADSRGFLENVAFLHTYVHGSENNAPSPRILHMTLQASQHDHEPENSAYDSTIPARSRTRQFCIRLNHPTTITKTPRRMIWRRKNENKQKGTYVLCRKMFLSSSAETRHGKGGKGGNPVCQPSQDIVRLRGWQRWQRWQTKLVKSRFATSLLTNVVCHLCHLCHPRRRTMSCEGWQTGLPPLPPLPSRFSAEVFFGTFSLPPRILDWIMPARIWYPLFTLALNPPGSLSWQITGSGASGPTMLRSSRLRSLKHSTENYEYWKPRQKATMAAPIRLEPKGNLRKKNTVRIGKLTRKTTRGRGAARCGSAVGPTYATGE